MLINVEEVVDFILQHKHYKRSSVIAAVNKHLEFETINTLEDDEGLIAVMLFNIKGECLHVLELIVRPEMRNLNIIKWMTAKTWPYYPFLKYFKFNRAKYPNRPQRAYSISRMMKG